MPNPDLKDAHEIILTRCPNGWSAKQMGTTTTFVFESTASLARNLKRLLGESKWEVEATPKPALTR